MKKYYELVLIPLISILVLTTIMTILNLFEISVNKLIITFLMIIITFVSGYILGKNIKGLGYLKGLIYGGAMSLIMFILSLILQSEHSFYNIIYYILIIASTTLGSMLGVNKRG